MSIRLLGRKMLGGTRRSPRTMGTGHSARLRRHIRDPQCHNRTSRRSYECDVPTGLTPQTATQAPIPAASSAAC